MNLPPLANLFAFHDDDPSGLEEVAADLLGSGEFTDVWRPGSGWVAAAAPLPRGVPDAHAVRSHGLAFAEGRDSVLGNGDLERGLRRLVDLVDSSPERLASLPGDFGFIRFRPRGAATVVRSCGGLAPFYLWRSGGRWAVSTRLGDFVRYLTEELPLDPLVNATWSGGRGFFPDDRTFLAGVSILARGHFARIEPARPITRTCYWDPRPRRIQRPSPAVAQEHAERLRAILVERLTQDLDPAGGNLLTLSGGVDSSSLGALAAGVVGRKVWTFSLLPAPQDLFELQMAFVRPLAERFQFERSWSIRIREQTVLELLRAAPRISFHLVHPALAALPEVQREASVSVLFGGEFADEVCGSLLRFQDWIAQTSPLALIAGLGRLPYGPRDVLRWARQRFQSVLGRPLLPLSARAPLFLRAEVGEQLRQWYSRRYRKAAHDPLPLRWLSLLAEEDGFLAMNWEVTSALRVRRCFPFFNRQALELAYECHPNELLGPGTKKLLRRALREDVPAKNLLRDKGVWGGYLRGARIPWKGRVPDTLEGIVRPDWCPSPPSEMDRSDAGALCQLINFVESIHARRLRLTGRSSRPHPGVAASSTLASLDSSSAVPQS